MADLSKLEPMDEHGNIQAIIESPRGSRATLKYEPSLGVFTVSRVLPLGVTYPFDWGFIPGTIGPDGDPLDALVLWDVPSDPGLLILCRPVALLKLEQREGKHAPLRNDRIILVPTALQPDSGLAAHEPLGRRQREQLEHFFLDAVFFMPKHVRVLGWANGAAAAAMIRKAQKRGAVHTAEGVPIH